MCWTWAGRSGCSPRRRRRPSVYATATAAPRAATSPPPGAKPTTPKPPGPAAAEPTSGTGSCCVPTTTTEPTTPTTPPPAPPPETSDTIEGRERRWWCTGLPVILARWQVGAGAHRPVRWAACCCSRAPAVPRGARLHGDRGGERGRLLVRAGRHGPP
jgi:hypothetical protein